MRQSSPCSAPRRCAWAATYPGRAPPARAETVATPAQLRSSLEELQRHAGEHAHAHVERALVKVERLTVVRAHQAAPGIGRTNEEEAARHFVEEQRHTLRASGAAETEHVVLAQDPCANVAHQLGHLRVVDRGRARVRGADIGLETERRGEPADNLAQAAEQPLAERRLEDA